MAEWYAKLQNNDGEYEITFKSKNYDEYKRVERVCCNIMDEHAGRKKTYAQDFLEKFPNAPVSDDGTPEICPDSVYKTAEHCCRVKGLRYPCKDCWNEVMPDA